MTYQEIKDRLTKCELTLEKIKDGTYTGKDITEKTQKLKLIKESLRKQLVEAEKGMVATDDENKAKELADKGVNVKLTSEMKPGSEEAGEHERMKKLSPKDQETISKIRAMMQAEKDKQLAQDQMDHDQETYDREIGEGDVDAVEDGGDLDVGHQDDEPNMLKKDLYDVITYAAKLYKQLDKYDQHDGEVDFPHWWQKKVTLAREYMSAAQHYLEGEEKQPAIDQLALEGKDGASKGEETKFHKDLDTLVHKTFGKRKEEMDENRFLVASMEDLEQVIRNLAHTGEMSEDEAIELAIRKLEAMLDGRDDIDEGRNVDDLYDTTVNTMKRLAKKYKAGDKSVVPHLKKLTDIKKKLEQEKIKKASNIGKGQELDPSINEYRGVENDIRNIIRDKAADSGFDEQEEAMEVMEFIGQEYGIDFEFGAGPSRQM